MARATTTSAFGTASAVAAHPSHATTIADLIECTKPGITRLVTITSLVGAMLGGSLASVDAGVRGGGGPILPVPAIDLLVTLVGCVLGTAFSAAGANALNMWSERARDACMERTADRPIPSGRVAPATALRLGVALSVLGVVGLWLSCGVAAATISAACVLTYLYLYTPMKATSPLSTIVGAVPGALPPLIGWYAVASTLNSVAGAPSIGHAGGWALFALMFVWQMPHFMAIAWKYREHYAAGGYRVLSVGDDTGTRTASAMLRWTLLLLPCTLLPAAAMPAILGPATIVVATLTGLGYLWLVLEFWRERTSKRAKAVFIASVMHLPVLLMVMVAEGGLRVLLN